MLFCAVLCCVCFVVLQRMVKRHVKPHTLLVGHSLDNDLAALKVRNSLGAAHCWHCMEGCAVHSAPHKVDLACTRVHVFHLFVQQLNLSCIFLAGVVMQLAPHAAAFHPLHFVTPISLLLDVHLPMQMCHRRVLDTVALLTLIS